MDHFKFFFYFFRNGPNIHIKQEPISDDPTHMCTPENQHSMDDDDHPSDDNPDHQGLEDDPEEDMEEAEDLSLSSSITSEPQAATCP